ncbi:MAG: hypothetical protein MR473_06010 [Clostridiales bacterium]|nr:hypothetical protein [Clostridiales bacterium]
MNADSYTNTGTGILGYNMFAYCNNNPVVAKDTNGEWLNIVIGAIVGGAVSAITTAIQTYKETGSIDIGKTIISGVVGAVSGGIAATGLGAFTQAGITAATAAVGDFVTQKYDIARGKQTQYDFGRTIRNTAVAAGCSLLGSAFGEITSGIRKMDGEAQIINGMQKYIKSEINDMMGKSYSNLAQTGLKLIKSGIRQVNIARGISSVTGTLTTWGLSQRYSVS